MEIVITPNSKDTFSLKELLTYRDLFYFMAIRDIKVKYRQTLIGIIWAILQPLISMIIFTIFFNKLAGISSGNIPYVLFSYSGLIFWNFFSTNIVDVSNSLVNSSSIISKVYFPRIIIPISSIVSGTVDFFFSAVILIVLMLYFKNFPTIFDFFAILLSLFALTIFVIGLGCFLAVINARYRDVRYILPFFIQIFLFLTPIIYPISSLPSNFVWLFYFNPLTGLLDFTRGVIFGNFYNPGFILISILSTIIISVFGLIWFNRYIKDVADVI